MIEVGEWIRTHTGEISKVFKVELAKEEREKYPNNPYKGYWRDKYVTDVRRGCCTRQVIKKHSKDVTELLEVGDAIKYVEQTEGKDGTELYGIYVTDIHNEVELAEIKQEVKQNGIKILSIVTKEQFASMEYRLEV